MSNLQLQLTLCAVVAGQIGVLAWVAIRRRGPWPALLVNFVFAAGMLWSVAPYAPSEVSFAWSDPDSGWFDYKSTILTGFEAASFVASLLALRGRMAATVVAWVGFAGNFALSLVALLFAFTFEFKCCGYL
ncbi:MAG TPA: hypothetical protein VMB84_04765 [Stellaceae bacterium]|nr:hypothetical protein [Stellaceae bacterium]